MLQNNPFGSILFQICQIKTTKNKHINNSIRFTLGSDWVKLYARHESDWTRF